MPKRHQKKKGQRHGRQARITQFFKGTPSQTPNRSFYCGPLSTTDALAIANTRFTPAERRSVLSLKTKWMDMDDNEQLQCIIACKGEEPTQLEVCIHHR